MERLTQKIEYDGIVKYEMKSMVPSVYGIHKLGELEDKQEQGMLIETKCRVGDLLYRVIPNNYKEYVTCYVTKILINPDGMYFAVDSFGGICFSMDDIGRIFFFTEEESLAKMKKGD